jgi:hypothetical protein
VIKEADQLIFNSFPRSGNVFMGNIASQTLSLDMFTTLHIPEIYQVRELLNVAIFRKPEDAIASLMHKKLEFADNLSWIPRAAEKAFVNYQKYIKYAMENLDHIHIVNFDNVVKDAPLEIKKISERFDIDYRPGKKDFVMSDIDFKNDRLWKEKHDGHMPREKTDTRLEVENIVSGLEVIKIANDMHEEIIRFSA